MEHLRVLKRQLTFRIAVLFFGVQAFLGAAFGVLYLKSTLNLAVAGGLFLAASLIFAILLGMLIATIATIPTEALGKAVLHISPSEENVPAPQTDNLRIGREFVSYIAYELYQLASLQDNKHLAEHRREATQSSNILSHLPLPVFVFNKEQIVTFGSDAALSYCGIESAELFGKPLFDAVDLEFLTDFTLESWIADCQKNKVTDTAYWRRVRFKLKGDPKTIRNLDIAGYYNRDNPSGIEFIITMFDRSEEYAKDENSLSYLALAVHELRTPLASMRGHIEVFRDELSGKLDDEMQTFMNRLQASAQQLSIFVNNILNVAKVSEDQLSFKLAEENIYEIVDQAVQQMTVRAKASDKNLTVSMPKGIPTVAADRQTITEVLVNLIDNSIKYSGKTKDIKISAEKMSSGMVEITVEDHGVGIPRSVMPTLFEKFKRNYRNRSQISGTGLGLYISKAIVSAHGGEISVQSKENEGTSVTFSLKPFSELAEEAKNVDNNAMVRTTHGWIKNHSLYRR